MDSYVNDCVGCETCRHCGRDKVKVTLCDSCGGVCDVAYRDTYSREDLCVMCAVARACDEFEHLSDKEKLRLMNFEEGRT
jgi:hypothetical protein